MREQLLKEVKELSTSSERVEAILRQAQAELRSYVGSIVSSLFSHGATSAWRDIFHQALRHPKLSARPLQQVFDEHQHDYDALAAIGENPSAPLPLLYRVWAKAPDSFLQNPIVALLQLESPNFWGLLPPETMQGLLGLPDIGVDIFAHAIKHYTHNLREQVAQHPSAPEEILEALSNTQEERLLNKLARHPRLSLRIMERLLGDPCDSVRRAAAENPAWPPMWASLIHRVREVIYHKNVKLQPSLTSEELCALARCGIFLQGYVSQHASTPGAVLAALALNGWHPLCLEASDGLPASSLELIPRVSWRALPTLSNIAAHPNASEGLLRELSRHYHVNIRAAILRRESLPESIQEAFLRDVCLKSKLLLSQRQDLTEGVLLALSQEETHSLRGNAAANPRLPRERALELLYDKSPKVGVGLCQRPEPELLRWLTESQHPEVRAAAWKRLQRAPEAPVSVTRSYTDEEYEAFLPRGPYVAQLLTESALTPAWVLTRVAQSRREPDRVYAAQSQCATPALFAVLAVDPSRAVQAAVARNPKAPAALIAALARRGELLAQQSAENPALPQEALEVLLKKPSRSVSLRLLQHPSLSAAHQEQLLRGAPPGVLRQLAKEGRQVSVLEWIFAQRPQLKIKRLLSQNPHITKEMIRALQREKDLTLQNNLATRVSKQ